MPASLIVLYTFESPGYKCVIILTSTLGTIQNQREHVVDCGYKKTAAAKDYAYIRIEYC